MGCFEIFKSSNIPYSLSGQNFTLAISGQNHVLGLAKFSAIWPWRTKSLKTCLTRSLLNSGRRSLTTWSRVTWYIFLPLPNALFPLKTHGSLSMCMNLLLTTFIANWVWDEPHLRLCVLLHLLSPIPIKVDSVKDCSINFFVYGVGLGDGFWWDLCNLYTEEIHC